MRPVPEMTRNDSAIRLSLARNSGERACGHKRLADEVAADVNAGAEIPIATIT